MSDTQFSNLSELNLCDGYAFIIEVYQRQKVGMFSEYEAEFGSEILTLLDKLENQ